MDILPIFGLIWLAMIFMSIWESSVEGRNAWDKGKTGWKLKFGKQVILTRYHTSVWIMWILILTLPFTIIGWNKVIFGVILSAFFSGMVLEDFCWYLFNPKVKFKEFWSPFSDYYPWIRINNKKVIPLGYIIGIIFSVLSWYFLWR
jgi:hypothetical protein